eukprot:COSAG02_NODE_1730_length_11179_cov_8.564350_2_plen_184_part_00
MDYPPRLHHLQIAVFGARNRAYLLDGSRAIMNPFKGTRALSSVSILPLLPLSPQRSFATDASTVPCGSELRAEELFDPERQAVRKRDHHYMRGTTSSCLCCTIETADYTAGYLRLFRVRNQPVAVLEKCPRYQTAHLCHVNLPKSIVALDSSVRMGILLLVWLRLKLLALRSCCSTISGDQRW